jgi:NADH-quinone oxidoreductase subunit J
MSTPGIGLFLFCALCALLSAVGTVVVKSSIRAAMSLLVHIVALSGLFLTLHAHLLAALQLLVYAGAVVVLFVFVIMMIGPNVGDHTTLRGLLPKTAAAALMSLLAFGFSATLAVYAPARSSRTARRGRARSACSSAGSAASRTTCSWAGCCRSS